MENTISKIVQSSNMKNLSINGIKTSNNTQRYLVQKDTVNKY